MIQLQFVKNNTFINTFRSPSIAKQKNFCGAFLSLALHSFPTWYWKLGTLVRAGLCWMVSTMGLPGAADPSEAGSWITFPFADKKPRFLGGAGAMGAGFMGSSLRGWGCAGGGDTGAWAAGGPILLQVAARRARGEGWASCCSKTQDKIIFYVRTEILLVE